MAPPTLTLVGRTAFRSFRNVWMLEEHKAAYEHVLAFPRSKLAHEYHPLGKIPALVVKEAAGEVHTVLESAAINTYLGDLLRGTNGAPTRALVPAAGTPLRGRYEQWVLFIQSEIDAQGLWIHRKHEALGEVFGRIPDAVDAAYANFKRALDMVAADIVQRGPYLLGEHFSAADILLVHCLGWADTIGWEKAWEDAPADHPAAQLPKYMERCTGRPAYIAARNKQKDEDRQLVEKRKAAAKAAKASKL